MKMKHFILSLLAMLCCATASADTLVTPPAEAAAAKSYYALAYSYAHGDNLGYTLNVVRDGNDIYIQGLFDYLPEAWIKGAMDGNTAHFPSGQYVGSVNPKDFQDYEHESYDAYMFCSTDLNTTCDLEIEYNPLNDTWEAYYQYILFSEKENIRSRFEHLQNLTFFSGQKVKTEAPADLVTTSYRMNAYECSVGKDLEYYVKVGFKDDKVYVQGISEVFPDAWVCGTMAEGGDVYFMRNQYLGPYQLGGKTYDIWFTGINHDEAYFTTVNLHYDAATGVFTQPVSNWLVINGAPAEWRWLNNMTNVVLTPDEAPQDNTEVTTLVTPPAGLVTPPFRVTGTDYSFDAEEGEPLTPYDVAVGFDGNDVYVQGLFCDMPEAWAKGRLETSPASGALTLTFPESRYFGKWYDTMDCWMMGSGPGGAKRKVVFTYDAAEGAFVLNNGLLVVFNDDAEQVSVMALQVLGRLKLQGELPEGVASLSVSVPLRPAAVYDASGAKVRQQMPGIYIADGKKFIVK